MMEVKELVTQCAPWESNDEDYADHQEYLVSMLSSELDEDHAHSSSDANTEQLFEVVDQFFDNPDASRKLVDLWKEFLALNGSKPSNVTTSSAAFSLGEGIETKETMSGMKIGEATSLRDDDETVEAAKEAPTSPRLSRKERKHKKKKGARASADRRRGRCASPPPADAKGDTADLGVVVSRIRDAADRDLDGLDDFSSAWEDVRESGRAWGGRGCGGRGVNRGLGAYRGRDAVVSGLTLTFGGKELLRETHLVIAHGHRYGLWGKNGVGKSTLLRRIAQGRVPGWPLHLSISMVDQEVLGTRRTVRECIGDVEIIKGGNVEGKKATLEEELAALEAKLAELADENDADALEEVSERMSELYEELDDVERRIERKKESSSLGGDSASSETTAVDAFSGLDESVVAILKGLQFEDSMLDTPVDEMSGGWRMRVALAEALYSQPDILLMDEPTNHLDASAQIFLEGYILENDLTIVIVSHDGHFLDAVCTDMIKFENQKLEYHVGNYSTFRQRESELWTKNRSIADAALKKEKKAYDFINKQKSMSNSRRRDDNKQRQAKEREKKVGRIGLYNADGKKFKLLSERKGVNTASHIQGAYTNAAGFMSFHVDNSKKEFGEQKQLLNFRFPSAEPLKGATGEYAPLITMDGCRFRYNASSDWLLRDMTLNVSVGSRIALLGKNGSGKTTLVKLLCGDLLPDSEMGAFCRHANLKVARIDQHHVEQLGSHLEKSSVDYFLTQHRAKNEYEARQFLGGFGLVGPLALQPIGTLSGGQKARLAFATVMYKAPHVLVLDEPTNHLDSDSLSSLERAIEKFGGAVVTVSHNQDFLSRVSKEVWTIDRGRVNVEAVADPGGENETCASPAAFDDVYARYKKGLREEVRREQKQHTRQQQTKQGRNTKGTKGGRR